jgi:hypothetical protein
MGPMRALLVLSIAAALASGCRIGGPGNAGATAEAPSLVAIPTAEPPDIQAGCMDALMTGQLVADEEAGLVVVPAGGPPVVVIWPHGWVAVDQDGMRILLNERGDPVARAGDQLQLAGGMVENDRWLACGEITRLP